MDIIMSKIMMLGAAIAIFNLVVSIALARYVIDEVKSVQKNRIINEIEGLRTIISIKQAEIEKLKQQEPRTPETMATDIFRIKEGPKKGLLSYKKASER